MLQEAVDALDNGRHVTGATTDRLSRYQCEWQASRFRQNLLGKRVDYLSPAIVSGPSLKLNQCGLPKKMALVLFEPFIIRRLKELGLFTPLRRA